MTLGVHPGRPKAYSNIETRVRNAARQVGLHGPDTPGINPDPQIKPPHESVIRIGSKVTHTGLARHRVFR